MARKFEAGHDIGAARADNASAYGITEKKWDVPTTDPTFPLNHGDWVNRIMVYGDEALRDRIVDLLMRHGL